MFDHITDDHNPLEYRTYKAKKPEEEFYCPLCRTKRAISNSFRLKAKNYLQVLLVSIVLMSMMYPWMQFKSAFVFFIVWAGFEAGFRMSYRKEIPCPHCGFDASWYKKDVKIARKLVEEFWDEQEKLKAQAKAAKGDVDLVEPSYDDYIPTDQMGESSNASNAYL